VPGFVLVSFGILLLLWLVFIIVFYIVYIALTNFVVSSIASIASPIAYIVVSPIFTGVILLNFLFLLFGRRGPLFRVFVIVEIVVVTLAAQVFGEVVGVLVDFAFVEAGGAAPSLDILVVVVVYLFAFHHKGLLGDLLVGIL